jgi:Nuclease A inhibitor-like protein
MGNAMRKKARDPVLKALAQASEGLRYTSETDAGFTPFAWKDGARLTEEKLLQLAGAEPGTAVEQTTLDAFFRLVPSEDRPQFQKLAAALRGRLLGVQVYKVGDEPEKQVYIVGKAPDGRWAGLKTTVVET